MNPVRDDILESLGVADLGITCGAVCVYPARVADAVAALDGSGLPVAAVATGFPSGQIRLEHKLEEIRYVDRIDGMRRAHGTHHPFPLTPRTRRMVRNGCMCLGHAPRRHSFGRCW